MYENSLNRTDKIGEKVVGTEYGLSEIKKRISFDGDFNNDVGMRIIVSKGEVLSESQKMDRAIGLIKNRYWFLNDLFSSKETPNEVVLYSGDIVYDFTGKLDIEKLNIINTINSFFTKAALKYNLSLPKYLLFDDESVENFNSGFPMNAQVKRNFDAIQFYPAAIKNERYKSIEESKFPEFVNHFIAVIIHEYSHIFEPIFSKTWKESFGWVHLNDPIKLHGDSYKMESCLDPEACMGEYALFHSKEDFCESCVGYFLCPDVLANISMEKYRFLEDVFDGKKIDFDLGVNLNFDIKKQWSRLPDQFNVTIKESQLVWH